MKALDVYSGFDGDGCGVVIIKFTPKMMAMIEGFPHEMNPFHQDDSYNGNPVFEEYQDEANISFDYEGETARIIMTPFVPVNIPRAVDMKVFHTQIVNGVGKWLQDCLGVNCQCQRHFDGTYEFDIMI